MQSLAFGENFKSSGNTYLRVKQKGDKIQFRIAQAPSYVGKHFLKKEGGWDVPSCPRINDQGECDTCELYFKGMAESKKLKEVDKKQSEKTAEEANKFKSTVTFYFPVLDRGTETFGILQTTMGVRNKINEFHEAGTDVMSKDFILRNTGLTGRDLYSLTMVDSADTKPFTDKEKVEYKKAQEFDLTSINEGQSQQDEELE